MRETKMLNIIILDDHTMFRKGLKRLLEESAHIGKVYEVSNATELCDMLDETEVNAIILDISMPDRSGLDILKELKRDRPKLPVLILSMHPEEQYAIRALKTGASGYVTKERAPEELVNAILKVSRGGKYISDVLAEQLALSVDLNYQKPLHETLSNREYEIMLLIASSKGITEISRLLNLSKKTVSTYRARILKKMNQKNNAELMRYVIENNLIN